MIKIFAPHLISMYTSLFYRQLVTCNNDKENERKLKGLKFETFFNGRLAARTRRLQLEDKCNTGMSLEIGGFVYSI